jgi:DNA polymerase-3 subunit alpha/error-prone DNA polymerase
VPRHVGRRITVAGWLVTGKVVSTHAGQPMEFLTFEDETGLVETTLFPRQYARYCHMLNNAGPYLITGLVEEDFDVATLTIDTLALVRPKRHLAWNEHAESASTRDAARGAAGHLPRDRSA